MNSDKRFALALMVVLVLVMALVWNMANDMAEYDEQMKEEPEVEYHLINITAHEVNREAYAYLDDNGTLIWRNRYHLAFEYTIEMTYEAFLKGDVEHMYFWLNVNNETIAVDEWGWSGLLIPGERRTVRGTYTPDVWVEHGMNLTIGFDFWHTYASGPYQGHSGIGRVEVEVEAPWDM